MEIQYAIFGEFSIISCDCALTYTSFQMLLIIVRRTWCRIGVLVEQLDTFGASWERNGPSQDMR